MGRFISLDHKGKIRYRETNTADTALCLQSTVYSLQSTVYSLQSTVYCLDTV